MQAKERVLAAICHQPSDRVPIDILLAPEFEAKLGKHLGIADRGALYEWIGQDMQAIAPVFKHPATDTCYADPTIEIDAAGNLLDIYRVPFRAVETQMQTYVELSGKPPLAGADRNSLASFPWPRVEQFDYSQVAAQIAKYPDKALWGHSRGFFEISHFMRGMDTFLMDLALDPDMACDVMDRIIAFLYARSEKLLQAGGGKLMVFEYNDDIASQRGLFISPDMWRRFIKPRMAKFCELIHRHKAFVRYHSCGSCYAIIPDLIEIGVDILNPIQTLAADMNPYKLKKEFGDKLCLHGGIDIQELLPHASPSAVFEEVKRILNIVGKDGGYILAGSHCIQADTPMENFLAMMQALTRREYSPYGLI